MIRLFDRNFATTQTVYSLLNSIFGINKSVSLRICGYVGVSASAKLLSIPKVKLKKLELVAVNKFVVERPLRREYIINIDQKIKKGTYVGLRMRQGLPTRGQRTHTNAKTIKRFKILK